MSVLQGQFEVSEIICTYLQTSQGEYEKMVPEQVKQREKCKEPIYLHIHVLLRGSKVQCQKLKALCDCFSVSFFVSGLLHCVACPWQFL